MKPGSSNTHLMQDTVLTTSVSSVKNLQDSMNTKNP